MTRPGSPVVYIGAVGRSGTTLLERTLATSPHAIALGEVVHLWDRSVRDGEPCGCGEPIRSCPFWERVGAIAFGGWDAVDLDALAADRRRVDRNRYIPFLIAPRLAPASFREARERLIDVLEQLYDAVETVSLDSGGRPVLIDSSKHPSYLFVLRGLRRRRVRLLHVVRDPRGVAHSWAKRVDRPEDGAEMERLGTLRAIARWTSHNLLFQLAGLVGVRRSRLPYERFTNEPLELGVAVDELIDDGARSIAETLQVDGNSVILDTDHTVSGNPMRFSAGVVSIRADHGWRSGMPRLRQVVVATLTTPLRQGYAR